jgi:hypothetical protein
MGRSATIADARVVLLQGLIDHAPLFPPASMAIADALAEDRRVRESDAAVVLGRFVTPASMLAELGSEERALSVVLDDELPDDPRVEAVEARLPGDLTALAGLAAEVYVELPLDADLERHLDALAELGFRAKVRCGGDDVPTVEALARFVRACRERHVVFKATAGLHHAVRSGAEHGLLNMLAAVVFGDEERALAEREPTSFELSAAEFRWRESVAGVAELETARRERLNSIGSCSFFEPVEELRARGFLPL